MMQQQQQQQQQQLEGQLQCPSCCTIRRRRKRANAPCMASVSMMHLQTCVWSLFLCTLFMNHVGVMGCDKDDHLHYNNNNNNNQTLFHSDATVLSDDYDCGTPLPNEMEVLETMQQQQDWERERRQLQSSSIYVGSYTIPVFVHIIDNVGGTSNTNDISESQVKEMISLLNEAYAGTPFQYELRSTLRQANRSWYNCNKGNDDEFKAALRNGGTDALNLYICDTFLSGFRGWASYPWRLSDRFYDSQLDGVVLNYRVVPGAAERPSLFQRHTTTHEVGHWLGLFHTFEGQPTSTTEECTHPGDGVDDTPAHKPPPAENVFDCTQTMDTCVPDSVWPGTDPNTNYMNVNNEDCRTEFTRGQIQRMTSMFEKHRLLDPTPEPIQVWRPRIPTDAPIVQNNPNPETQCVVAGAECVADDVCCGENSKCVVGVCVLPRVRPRNEDTGDKTDLRLSSEERQRGGTRGRHLSKGHQQKNN